MNTLEITKLQSAIEAILFTMGDSVELSKIAYAISNSSCLILYIKSPIKV